jgi:CelD/BcsL family acetyltransferase involved in cellulose biosynthesis
VTINTLGNDSDAVCYNNGVARPSDAVQSVSPLSFEVLRPQQLTDGLRESWNALRASGSHFRSPFFSPRFIEAVSNFVDDIEISIATRGKDLVAVFPFQRHRGRIAHPVGFGINDAHGLISNSLSSATLIDMLRASGLNSFPFHASPLECSNIQEFEFGRTRSFLADLTVDPLGYEHFLRSTSHTIDRQGQKTRRLAREEGELRFEFDCRDPQMLQHLLDLKAAQYRRTHIFNILGVPWIRQLVQHLHQENEHDVRGILNVLYAGDKPVALHYGIVEGDLLHYWFPVFDPKYSYGSPGTQLFLEVANTAVNLGYTAIDMGYGEQPYKEKLTNVITEMSYGLVDENPRRHAWHRRKLAFRNRLKQLKFKQMLKPIARTLLPGFGRRTYEP